MLDNDLPASIKTIMHSEGVDFQLVPPHHHRTNAAQRAIQTYKYHLVNGLISCDKDFPVTPLRLSPLTINLDLLPSPSIPDQYTPLH